MSACLMATLIVAGCGAAMATAPATGHVTGKWVMEGGPLGPGGKQPAERPMSGTVTFSVAGRQVASVKVGTSGTFSVPLPPGRYQLSGRSPDIVEVDGRTIRESPCSSPASATVTAGQTVTVTLTCIVP
jgi:hypothetical protein